MDPREWTVTNERQDASPLLGFLPLFSSMTESIGKYLESDIELEFLVEFSNRHVRMAAVVSDWEKAGVLTVSRLESDDFVNWVFNGLASEAEALCDLGNTLRATDFSRLSDEQLAARVADTISALDKFIVYNNFVNTSDFYHNIFTTKILTLLRTALSPNAAISAEAAYSTLTTPDKSVWIQEEEVSLLEILARIQGDPDSVSILNSDFKGERMQELKEGDRLALEKHTEEYFWIRYEQEGEIITQTHFYKTLVKMSSEGINASDALLHARERKARVSTQHDTARSALVLNDEVEHFIAVAQQLVYWKLHLREVKVRFYCCADNLLNEIARRLDLDRYQVRHLMVEELLNALQGDIEIDSASLRQRIEYCVFRFSAGQTFILEGQKARDAFSVVRDEHVSIDAQSVKGTCAYPGLAEGVVKQVLAVEDGDQFRRGNVLVAYMTDVGIVPAMRKACAIVTDVGGVTCHASIIAREFGIPCVIGTKNATKVLLDGYRVRVDAEAGNVTILSREVGHGFVAEHVSMEADKLQVKKMETPIIHSPLAVSECIRRLDKLASDSVNSVGGKGNSLGELLRLNLPVPPGFVVSTSVFNELIFNSATGKAINELLVGIVDQQSLQRNAQAIQRLVASVAVPDSIVVEIGKAFARLSSAYVAVRSSATSEDSASASWAGQLESFLNVTDDMLLTSIKQCWASIFSDRAIAYRTYLKSGTDSLAVAVVVQKMVESRVAGTAFSVHPVSGASDSVLIEACIGLGETLVLGKETPATYMVSKSTLEVSCTGASEQKTGLRRAKSGNGNELFEVPQADSGSNVLTEDEARQVAVLVARVEKEFGFPVDVEWAFEGETLYLLQSRPITAIANSSN
jgi:phosphohistidine swiveling domain-containing protein